MKTTLGFFLTSLLFVPAQGQVLAPGPTLFGKTMAEYSAEWFIYNFSLSTNQDPVHLPAGPPGNAVYFLAASAFGDPDQEHVFTVPENVFVFVPIIANWADNVDTEPPYTVEGAAAQRQRMRNRARELFSTMIPEEPGRGHHAGGRTVGRGRR